MASATTDFPRPSNQFTAAGFLSVQKFPKKNSIYIYVVQNLLYIVYTYKFCGFCSMNIKKNRIRMV